MIVSGYIWTGFEICYFPKMRQRNDWEMDPKGCYEKFDFQKKIAKAVSKINIHISIHIKHIFLHI